MHISLILMTGLLVGAGATPFELERRGCGNNCARGEGHDLLQYIATRPIFIAGKLLTFFAAVIASASPMLPTRADCSSILGTTITPSTTVTVSVTATGIVTLTTMPVVHSTQTVTSLETATITNMAISSVLVTSTATTTVISAIPLYKRVAGGNSIPAYASACSSMVDYTAACGCIGVTPFTTSLATQTKTVTVTVSITSSTTVIQPTTETEYRTQTNTATITKDMISVTTVTQQITVSTARVCLASYPAVCLKAFPLNTEDDSTLELLDQCIVFYSAVPSAAQCGAFLQAIKNGQDLMVTFMQCLANATC
ncbi:hypothetical protein GQ53DRAFT_827838 [Thozetella sp. PMI_491]|nr:hypothetical protein GQ53DRAFT_827838 [Thozetella sp. PMI_491]